VASLTIQRGEGEVKKCNRKGKSSREKGSVWPRRVETEVHKGRKFGPNKLGGGGYFYFIYSCKQGGRVKSERKGGGRKYLFNWKALEKRKTRFEHVDCRGKR